MNPTQASKILGCTPTHVRHMIRNGVIKAKKNSIGESYSGKEMFQYNIDKEEVQRVKKLKIKPRGMPRGGREKIKSTKKFS